MDELATRAAPASQGPLGHRPALDGIRGLSIVLVLLFHGGWHWMPGGYVGVSVFFSLSGFLITTLLFEEHDRTGTIDFPRFFARRLRRLVPASLVCLAGVSVLSALGWLVSTDRLRGDVIAALLQVANWRALTGTQSYADLVAAVGGAVGPVDHFWSLSIEEQFYWIWPVCCAVMLRRVASPRGRLVLLGSGVAVAAAANVLIATRVSGDAAYWSTPARLCELLVGTALAAVVRWRDLPSAARLLGIPAAATVVWAAVRWPSGSGPAYEGWMPAFALVSAALIAAALVDGPLQTAMSWRPLVALGAISYGVYLYHWPLFAVLSEQRVGVGGAWLFVVRVAATLVVAIVSYRFVERPIRRADLSLRVVAPVAVAASAALVAVALVMLPIPQPTFVDAVDTAGVGFLDESTTAGTSESSTVSSAPGSSTTVAGSTPTTVQRPLRVVLIGDSTAVALGAGMAEWARRSPDVVQLESVAAIGCGVILNAPLVNDEDGRFMAICAESMGPVLDAVLARGSPDIAVVLVTLPDSGVREWSATEGPLSANDPRYRARRLDAYTALVRRLTDSGVRRVLLLVPPAPNDRWLGYRAGLERDLDSEGLRSMISELSTTSSDVISVDFATWLEAQEVGDAFPDGQVWRSDGLHLDPTAAELVVERFLAPRIMAASDEPR